ncbi:MAG: phosphatase PAP2 family protein [Parvibaculaceae bacterium]
MSLRTQILITIAVLVLVLLGFEATNIDVWTQNHFYNATALTKAPLDRWLISKNDPFTEQWLHVFPRNIAAYSAVALLIAFAASFFVTRLAPYRSRALFLALAIAFTAFFVGGAKRYTNTYCPSQTTLYGGDMPHVAVLESYPKDFHPNRKARCFPAGHATAGFSFMALWFIFRDRRAKIAGLSFGVADGWALGTFQMVRGEHFLSHTVVSMVACWLVILLLAGAFDKATKGSWRRAFPE